MVDWFCDRGDRALQECNLSTRLVRRLQVTQAPILRLWDRDFVLLLQTRPKAKNSSFIFDEVADLWFSRESLPLGVTGLSAEQRPDEAAEFAGDGDLGFVALQTTGQQPLEAVV